MVGEMIVRIVSSLLSTAVSWNALKKDAESTTLVLAKYVDRLLLVVEVISIVVVMILSKTAVRAM